MKIILKRSTNSTILGGKSSYSLTVRAQLEGDEAQVIKKNSLGKEILVWHEKTGPAESITGAVWKLMRDTRLTVDSFVKGTTFSCKNVAEMVGIEWEVKEAALNLQTFIEMARNFGGEEVMNVNEELKALVQEHKKSR